MKKRILALLTVLILVTLTGCDDSWYAASSHVYAPYQSFFEPLYKNRTEYVFLEEYILDGEYAELAENCFENIKVGGITFSLPMNVSDLPEGCTIKRNEYNEYNGFSLSESILYIDDSPYAYVTILCPTGASESSGQIISMTISGYGVTDFGCFSTLTPFDEVYSVFGVDTENRRNIFRIGNTNKTIKIYSSGNNPDCYIETVILSIY